MKSSYDQSFASRSVTLSIQMYVSAGTASVSPDGGGRGGAVGGATDDSASLVGTTLDGKVTNGASGCTNTGVRLYSFDRLD